MVKPSDSSRQKAESSRHRRLLPTALCLLLLLLAASIAVPAAAPADNLADRVSETTLDNGLKVLIVEEHKAPVVTVQVWYHVGSRNEQVGKTGLSHMLEHMMFKGTSEVGAKQFSTLIRQNGGQDNAFTTTDYTGYYIDFAADRVGLALRLEADRMAHLLLAPEDFLPERQVVMEERRLRIEDQPGQLLGETMRAAAFLAHPYRWPVIGWSSDIDGYTRDDLVRHYRTYYVPNNATLIVAGDIRKAEVLAEIQTLFGKIPRGPDPPAVITTEPPQRGERRIVVRKEAELPLVFAVYHVPTIAHVDAFALEVLAYVLGGGASARLHEHIVYDKRLATFATADYSGVHHDPHLFGLNAGPMPGKSTEEVEQALYGEVERIVQEPISDRELQKAKNQIEAEFVFAEDSVQRMARLLGSMESVASWKLLIGYLDGIRKVTAEDVKRVARRYLTPENRTVGILVPLPRQPSAAGRPGGRP
ncbi:MAG TPA: pitrilysin family protein [Candidatus Sulfotelmatobacter sp.]|nr:pitrilysin family protein [Candidatus Sulfotelmatobacter sp.]